MSESNETGVHDGIDRRTKYETIPSVDALRMKDTYPTRAYAWYVIGILMLVAADSMLDRQLPALLVKPIREAFAISDTQFGLLQGFGFVIFYSIMGVPLARLVDHHNRPRLIAGGIGIWSVFTVLSGLAASYWQLFFARMGVGVGEACLMPAAYSLIADYFPPNQRARALGAYYVAIMIGVGVSLSAGGLLLNLLPKGGVLLPLVGRLPPWKMTFLFAGAPGLILVLLLPTVKEPVRHELGLTKGDGEGRLSEFVAHIRANSTSFMALVACYTFNLAISHANAAWAPTLYQRRFGIPAGDIGIILGIVMTVGGCFGALVGGIVSDGWVAKGIRAGRFRVTLIGWALVIPAIAWPLIKNPLLSYVFLGVANVAGTLIAASTPATIQDIVPNRMRGQAVAICVLISGVFGIGAGPLGVGFLTDYLFGSNGDLPYSLVVFELPVAILGVWISWRGQKAYGLTYASLARLRSD